MNRFVFFTLTPNDSNSNTLVLGSNASMDPLGPGRSGPRFPAVT
eukprot:CAMPEP_0175072444 /NCGR_PEP_ID=MMETSP0052_2-20121109/19914_1 /TAXON_ID=51329 ORGANISM="Polytomella parva, Strain SAG 63-3" /NCGR_SAMPLE_ID=MMETSP0052_2 /ASSEMBLY_ACC=CAM_ASM_000194 /LENGTH=43 /DNA_ID= /DNA_START= /DNA_END= /DNA_ORIENTATION=